MPIPSFSLSGARQERREERLISKCRGDREREMHLLPAAPSHQFNQEYSGALPPVAVPAQPAMGKG